MAAEDGASADDGGRQSLGPEALDVLHDLWRNHQLCDAALVLEDGAIFPVHRAILSACSAFFRTLFTRTLRQCLPAQVLIHGVGSREMTAVLDYVYARSMDLDEEVVCDVLVASDYLAVPGACRRCCTFIKDALCPENCIAVAKFARYYSCSELARDARVYMMQNFVLVAHESQDLLDMTPEELGDFIGADELNARSEDVVWECVLRWVRHDAFRRAVHLPELLGLVRLRLMDTKYFIKHVKNNDLVADEPRCRPLVISTLRYLYDVTSKSAENVVGPWHACPRLPHQLLLAIGGWSAGTPTSCVEAYDSRADSWTQLQQVDPEGPRAYHGVAVIGENVYVVGGFNGFSYFNSCRCFNTADRTWREVAPMNVRRCYVSVSALDGRVYAMGGYDRPNRQNSAERYHPRTNQWSYIASMTVQRSDASATTLNGHIYVTGGFTGLECLSSAEMYDPGADRWSLIANMTTRRSGVSCAAHHGLLFVVGGFNGITRLSSAEVYDPKSNVWTRIASMIQTRSNFALEAVDGSLYAVGGFNGVTVTADVECYDEAADQWYEVSHMNQFRSALAACVVSSPADVRSYVRPCAADGSASSGWDTRRHRRGTSGWPEVAEVAEVARAASSEPRVAAAEREDDASDGSASDGEQSNCEYIMAVDEADEEVEVEVNVHQAPSTSSAESMHNPDPEN